jgi:DNA-binding transcriptional LysR family regulator
MLKAGFIDFGIGPDEGDLKGWEKQNIYEGNFGLYASTSLKRKQTQDLGFIVAEDDCKDTIFFKEAYREKYKKDPLIALEVNSWEMIANLTLEGLGIGYFPDYIALKKKDALKQYEADLAPFPYQIAAFFPKGMKLRRSSEIFLSYFNLML